MPDLSPVDAIIGSCAAAPTVNLPESWLWHVVVWVLCMACVCLGILLGRMSRDENGRGAG
jgi:hypothetical protein